MLEAILHTDGSSDAHGNGGWGVVIATPDRLLEFTGWATDTTNNRMEIMAAIVGLEELKTPHKVTLVSDSAYVLNTIKNGWWKAWLAGDGLKYFKGTVAPRKNLDLWERLGNLTVFHTVIPHKVRGHDGVYWNERADKLAVLARKQHLELRHESDDYEEYIIPDGDSVT